MNNVLKSLCSASFRLSKSIAVNIHTNAPLKAWSKTTTPKKFLSYNRIVFPPQQPGEEPRPSYVCHQKTNIKYSPDKLWYIASLIRGMTVDEAVKQLSFINKKGAGFVKQAVLEAQDLAVSRHNVEFKSNLWIAESFSTKGTVIKGMRRHAKARMGEVRYTYSHYFVRLEEGKPPKDYYKKEELTPTQQIDKWLEGMRKRKITNSY